MPYMTILSMILAFTFGIFGVPLLVAIGLACIIALFIFQPIPSFTLIPQLLAIITSNYVLTAIPLFILAGIMLEKGGIAHRLIAFVNPLVDWTPGGLGSVNIFASMIFGGCSGSSLADTASLGSVLIPRMKDEGYGLAYSAAVTATSSTLAPVIPPSNLLILYGVIAQVSIVRLLAGGLLPGILITILLIIPNIVISKKRKYGEVRKLSILRIFEGTKTGFLTLVTPIIILGGIISGFFTPTEAATVAVSYAFILMIIYKTFRIKLFVEILRKSAILTVSILLIAASSRLFAWIIVWEDVPKIVTNFIINITGGNTFLVLLLLNIFMLLIGMLLDVVCSIIIFTPIFVPLILSVGVDPIHFGVVMICNLAIGLVTPPFGVALFSTATVGNVQIEKIVKEALPFYAFMIIALLITTYFPMIVLFIPKLIF